jgi:hypothetical protein
VRTFFVVFACLTASLWAQTDAELNERLTRYEQMRDRANEADDDAELARIETLVEQVTEGLDMLTRLGEIDDRLGDAQSEMETGDAITRRQLLIELDALQFEKQQLSDRKGKYWEWVLAGEEDHEHLDAINKEYERYRKLSTLEVENRTVHAQNNSMGVAVAQSRRAANVRIDQSVMHVRDNRALLQLLAMWKKLTQLLEEEEPDAEAIAALKAKIARAEVSRKVRSEMTRIRNEHRQLRGQAQLYADAKIKNKATAMLSTRIDEVKMQEHEQKELVGLWDAVLEAKPEEVAVAEKAFAEHSKLVNRHRSVREIRSEIAAAIADGDEGAVESLKESLMEYEPAEDEDPRRLPATSIAPVTPDGAPAPEAAPAD